jgi:ankyrin repeat protein
LLKAGSDPNALDHRHRLPLHACAEFELDWIQEATSLERPDPLRASEEDFVKQTQQQRHRGRTVWGFNSNNHTSTRIRESVCLLLEYGSKLPANNKLNAENHIIDSPLAAAISTGCTEMVDELVSHMEKDCTAAQDDTPYTDRIRQSFQKRYLIHMTRPIISRNDFPLDGNASILCHDLLSLRQHKVIEGLPALGADFSPRPGYQNDFMTTLTEHGYVTLFEKLGTSIRRPGWINGIASTTHNNQEVVQPYLITAAHRVLPNLDMMKLLVEHFGADINIQPETTHYKNEKSHYVPGDSALHILARGNHWWNTEAVKYLLSRGANPELKNAHGQSVINFTNGASNPFTARRERKIVKILLEHGVDPNSMDENGGTRLSRSMRDIEMVRLLIKHGADISLVGQSVLFSAISTQDVATVSVLLEAGADCNAKPKSVDELKLPHNKIPRQQQDSELYPLHYAASGKFNTPKTRDSALLITRLLLKNGADPYLQCSDDTTIINDIFRSGGIIQPFLEHPSLRLEDRDSVGRTLLLAACQSHFGSMKPTTFPHQPFQSAEAKVKEHLEYTRGDPCRCLVVYEKGGDLMAVDNDGNNALHLLLQARPHDSGEFEKTFRIFLDKAPSLIRQKNAAGDTPFHIAVKNSRIWAAELLVEMGANPLEKDGQGNTPLHHFAPELCSSKANGEWLPLFEKFISLGLDINEKNNVGETPVFNYFAGIEKGARMFHGSNCAHREYFMPFEKVGTDLFVKNNEGETLLHLTAKKPTTRFHHGSVSDTVDAFKFLMSKGLDPMAEDKHQRTALVSPQICLRLTSLTMSRMLPLHIVTRIYWLSSRETSRRLHRCYQDGMNLGRMDVGSCFANFSCDI